MWHACGTACNQCWLPVSPMFASSPVFAQVQQQNQKSFYISQRKVSVCFLFCFVLFFRGCELPRYLLSFDSRQEQRVLPFLYFSQENVCDTVVTVRGVCWPSLISTPCCPRGSTTGRNQRCCDPRLCLHGGKKPRFQQTDRRKEQRMGGGK